MNTSSRIDPVEKVKTLRLICQLSVPVPDVATGDKFYEQIKVIVQSQSPKCTLNGQLLLMLEPCCGERKPPYVPNRALQSP